ncbi:hypothetical protein MNKW57_19950 [Biformimicrobium ophioploci]|uniref:Uncharacterized protein n=1 Tax=Biformimicrobium ophioploci TaxID=3036711 RepID=A0ABQ6M008_9GAMM|nr:hypothetical protein MNKW57_19950 [Microbulbifer sp. NKW57]
MRRLAYDLGFFWNSALKLFNSFLPLRACMKIKLENKATNTDSVSGANKDVGTMMSAKRPNRPEEI